MENSKLPIKAAPSFLHQFRATDLHPATRGQWRFRGVLLSNFHFRNPRMHPHRSRIRRQYYGIWLRPLRIPTNRREAKVELYVPQRAMRFHRPRFGVGVRFLCLKLYFLCCLHRFSTGPHVSADLENLILARRFSVRTGGNEVGTYARFKRADSVLGAHHEAAILAPV